MHTIHHTEAFILRQLESGEANRRVWLFTKEFGLVVATVQGVRKPTAKLRSHLVDYTLIAVDLVKGRDVWRLVSAEAIQNPFASAYDATSARTYIRALGLVERLCVEEGTHEDLFEHLVEILQSVGAVHVQQKLFDAVVLWKIVVFLGYVEVTAPLIPLFTVPLVSLDASKETTQQIITTVTTALQRSHL